MGCPGATRSVFTRAFRAKKKNFNVYFSANTVQRSFFFSYYNLFLGKLKEKLARKVRVNTDASISDRAHPPGHPIILLKPFNSIWPSNR